MSPFLAKPTNSRDWIVELHVYDDQSYLYGPYTEAAARKAVDRVQRWADRRDDDEALDCNVSCYPIHKWSKDDQ